MVDFGGHDLVGCTSSGVHEFRGARVQGGSACPLKDGGRA